MAQNRRVFFSYAAGDRVFAESLRKAMDSYPVQIFDPLSDVDLGQDWPSQIGDEITKSDLMVFIVPEKEGSGKSSLFELGAAKALGKRIVAVLPNSARAANTEVAARLADLLLLDVESKPASEIVRKILEKAA
jgi:hypothetical protein